MYFIYLFNKIQCTEVLSLHDVETDSVGCSSSFYVDHRKINEGSIIFDLCCPSSFVELISHQIKLKKKYMDKERYFFLVSYNRKNSAKLKFNNNKFTINHSNQISNKHVLSDIKEVGSLLNAIEIEDITIPNPYKDKKKQVDKNKILSEDIIFNIIGGCIMADHGSKGVVDHIGRVFIGNSEYTYKGLYLMGKASIHPRNIQPPAFLVMTLTERCARILKETFIIAND